MLERLDHHVGINAGRDIRISLGPGLGIGEGGELGNDQAAGETGFARVVAVYRRVRAGQYDAAFGLQLLEALGRGPGGRSGVFPASWQRRWQ